MRTFKFEDNRFKVADSYIEAAELLEKAEPGQMFFVRCVGLTTTAMMTKIANFARRKDIGDYTVRTMSRYCIMVVKLSNAAMNFKLREDRIL